MERLTQELTSRHADVISFARGLGVSYGIGIVNPDSKVPDPDRAFKIVYRAYEKGLILMTLAGNVLRIQPPVNISLNLLQGGFSVLSEAICQRPGSKFRAKLSPWKRSIYLRGIVGTTFKALR